MTNFVTGSVPLDFPKTDLTALPGGADPTKYLTAAQWNKVCQALMDLRAAVLDGAISVTDAVGYLEGVLNAITARSIIAGAGLTGGGDLSASRTLSLPDVGPGAVTSGGGTSFINSLTTDAKGKVTAITTGVPAGGGGGVSPGWTTALDIDFTAETTQTLTTGTVTLGGKTFFVDTPGSNLIDVLSGTGIRITPTYGSGASTNPLAVVGIRLPDIAAALVTGAPFRKVRAWFAVDASTSDYVGNKSLVSGFETHRQGGAYDIANQWRWSGQTGRNQWMAGGGVTTNFYATALRDNGSQGVGTELIANASAPDVIVGEWSSPNDCVFYTGALVAGDFPAFSALTPRAIVGISGPGSGTAPFAAPSRFDGQDLAIFMSANYPNGANGGATFLATFKRLLVEYV